MGACEAAAPDILHRALEDAANLARQKQPDLERQLSRLHEAAKDLEDRVRPQLNMLRDTLEVLYAGHFFDRRRADHLSFRLSEYEAQLRSRCYEARERAKGEERAVRTFLDPVQREQAIQKRLQQDLAAMKDILHPRNLPGPLPS